MSEAGKLCFSKPVSIKEGKRDIVAAFGTSMEEVAAFKRKVMGYPNEGLAESLAAVINEDGVSEAVVLVLLAGAIKVWPY